MSSTAPRRSSQATVDGWSEESRRVYVDALQRAMRHAAAHVDRDDARDIANYVAAKVVERTTESEQLLSVDAFIHRAVVNRLRDLWRSRRTRETAEEVFHEERSALAPAWSQPGVDLESDELHQVIARAIEAMPDAMRKVFLLVRRDERSYKDAAVSLGIGIGTVHTQLSRANALLRLAVANYRADQQIVPVSSGRPVRNARP
jgi:RNA polymerase sigma factor (sigma-70 family)